MEHIQLKSDKMDFPLVKKIAKQIGREFGAALIFSLLWSWYTQFELPFSFKGWLSTFGPTFFLTSWMTGQIFRVKKQAGIETSFEKLESRLEHLVSRAEEQTQEMISHITGGNGFCMVMTHRNNDDTFSWLITFNSTYPMYDVTIRIVDVDRMRRLMQSGGAHLQTDYTTTVNMGDCIPGTIKVVKGPLISLPGLIHRSLNIFTSARNGYTYQQVRMMMIEGNWIIANRIMRGVEVVFESLPSEFPVDKDGKYDWDQSDA